MHPQSPSDFIRLENLSFSYHQRLVLDNVNTQVGEGEYLGVIGPNGSGKTTLLKLILGLLRPTAGQIFVAGKPPTHMRKKIGYVPQLISLDLDFPINVKDVVATGFAASDSLFAWLSLKNKAKLESILEKMNLTHLAKRRFGQLSGGEQKRSLIARALIHDPLILLLDEPTAGLDPKAEKEILELLHALSKNLTLLQVSHDMNFVSSHIQRVLCVSKDVRIHETKSLTRQFLNELYLGDKKMVLHKHCPKKP